MLDGLVGGQGELRGISGVWEGGDGDGGLRKVVGVVGSSHYLPSPHLTCPSMSPLFVWERCGGAGVAVVQDKSIIT